MFKSSTSAPLNFGTLAMSEVLAVSQGYASLRPLNLFCIWPCVLCYVPGLQKKKNPFFSKIPYSYFFHTCNKILLNKYCLKIMKINFHTHNLIFKTFNSLEMIDFLPESYFPRIFQRRCQKRPNVNCARNYLDILQSIDAVTKNFINHKKILNLK